MNIAEASVVDRAPETLEVCPVCDAALTKHKGRVEQIFITPYGPFYTWQCFNCCSRYNYENQLLYIGHKIGSVGVA